LIPKTIATTTAANPSTDPMIAPAIVAFSEPSWRASVGDGVDHVTDDEDNDVDTDIIVLSLEKWLPTDVTGVEGDKNVDLLAVSQVLSIKQEGIC
jgi:hypothetical protein